ncbi:hypothetical protein AAG570_008277, partial [Ranatra chinensis]
GILERPAIIPGVEELSYKLLFFGKSSVGKTTTIARLAGVTPSSSYIETSGIRFTDIYWPVKIWDKIILFKLQCWEAGSNSMKKYSHIPTSCKDRADVIIFLFAFNNASSFADLPALIDKTMRNYVGRPAVSVIGTRSNFTSKIEVTKSDIKEFEAKFNLNVLTITNSSFMGSGEVNRIAPVLNTLCEQLWVRDQHYILNQGITV